MNDSGFKEHWPPLKQQQYLVEAKDFLLQVALQLQHDCKADLDTNWPDLDVEKRTKAIRDFELYCSNIFPFELFQASVPVKELLMKELNRLKKQTLSSSQERR